MNSQFTFERWNTEECLFKKEQIKSELVAESIIEKNPDITFTIPAYRRADAIGETIKSIFNQKTCYSFVVMVVDDSGKSDEVTNCVLKLIKEYPNIILYKNAENIGQAANWNRCIELVNTKWMVLIHDDDMICEDYLEKAFPVAQRYGCTELGVFQYKYDLINHKDGRAKGFNGNQSIAQKILRCMRNGAAFRVKKEDVFQFVVPSPGCWMINREKIVNESVGFDERYGVTLDGIFHFRNIYSGNVFILPEFLMIRRVEENTFLKSDAQIAVIDMLYHFGKHELEKYNKVKKWMYKNVLDISTVYLANGIKDKYEGSIDVKNILGKYGVSRFYLCLPSKVIYLLNCFSLVKLIFRKHMKL